MKVAHKFLIVTVAFLAIVGVFALLGNANQSARAAFSIPFGSSQQVNSADAPKLGVVELKGTVDSIQADSYTVSGLTFRFDTLTIISGAPVVGDSVEVKALLLPDLTRYALKIELQDEVVTTPSFEFHGLVEAMAADMWTVSGEQVQVTVDTVIDADIAAGALVEVKGEVVGGLMVADSIELKENMPGAVGVEVEIFGTIESITGTVYVVGGKTVNTDAATEITGVLAVGSFVKVHASLNADGTFQAREIELMTEPAAEPGDDDDQGEDQDDQDDQDEDMDEDEVKLTGVLESMTAGIWVVDGVSFVVDLSTKIEGDIQVGDIVKIKGHVQSDGTTVLAHKIELEDDASTGSDDDSEDSDDNSGSSGSDDDDQGDDDEDGDSGDDDEEDEDDDAVLELSVSVGVQP
ncbi:MAG: hypothetical protein A2X24_12735 [Chloroflexi bacterium GWB2_54_36]|nr:MAG: hypothetical protein A2X24_12735 [Chloroflexi bacterium GWB2_54_36]